MKALCIALPTPPRIASISHACLQITHHYHIYLAGGRHAVTIPAFRIPHSARRTPHFPSPLKSHFGGICQENQTCTTSIPLMDSQARGLGGVVGAVRLVLASEPY